MHCCDRLTQVFFSKTNFYFLRQFLQKFKCLSQGKCVAYTFEKSRLETSRHLKNHCTLHSSTEKGKKYIRGKQTGVKKTDYFLSFLEMSFCLNKNRQRRCQREPKCHHKICSRNAQNFLLACKWYNTFY